MAVVPGNAITITGPGVYQIPYPGGGTQPTGASHQWTQIKLENASPFPLTFALGGTPVHTIPAGIADVFPLTLGPSGPGAPTAAVDAPAQPLTVTAGPAQQPPAQTTGTLRPSFGQYGDRFPGVYPVSLPGNLFAQVLPPSAGSLLLLGPSFGFAPGTTGRSPVVDVSSMAVIEINTSCSGSAPSNWTVEWFTDAAGVNQVGQPYTWSVTTGVPHTLIIAPQAAFCQVQVTAATGGAQFAGVGMTGFPQPVERGEILPPSVQFAAHNLSVPANTLLTPQFATTYTPGRFTVWGDTSQPAVFRLESLTSSGGFVSVWQVNTNNLPYGGAASVLAEVILSADDYRITIGNLSTTTAAQMDMSITGPLS